MSKKAIILAGGKGQRLWPLTADKPKCMVEVCGIPIISYQLHWLKKFGFTEITVATGYQSEIVEQHAGDGSKWGVQIRFSLESKPLGRGGALKKALKSLNSAESVIALNGDIFSNLDLRQLLVEHQNTTSTATIVTVPLVSPYGILDIDQNDGLVRGFREKPMLPYEINAGIYVFSPEIIDMLPDLGDHEVETFPHLADAGKLRAHRSKAFWRAVDTVKDVSELGAELEKMFLGALFEPSAGA